MLEALTEALQETSLGFVIVGVAGLALLASLGLLVIAWLREGKLRKVREAMGSESVALPLRRFSLVPELLLVGVVLAIIVLTFTTVDRGHSSMLEAKKSSSPVRSAELLATGISATLNGTAVGSSVLMVLFPLVGLVLGALLGARLRLGGLGRAKTLLARDGGSAEGRAWLAHPGPRAHHILPVTGGFGFAAAVFCAGFVRWVSMLVAGFGAVAAVDPEQKAKLTLQSFAEARTVLNAHMLYALIVCSGALVLVFVSGAAAKRRKMAPQLAARRPSWAWTLAGAAAALVLSCLAVVAAGPYREANNNPLPVSMSGRVLGHALLSSISAPRIEGPDPLRREPILMVSLQSVKLESVLMPTASRLTEQLGRMKQNWSLTHPGQKWPGSLILVADRRVRVERLDPLVRAAVRAGYHEVLLAFGRSVVIESRLFGRLPSNVESAAKLSLVVGPVTEQAYLFDGAALPTAGSLVLEPPPTLEYQQLAKVVVAARQLGRAVTWVVRPRG